jgi:hypothetical protein
MPEPNTAIGTTMAPVSMNFGPQNCGPRPEGPPKLEPGPEREEPAGVTADPVGRRDGASWPRSTPLRTTGVEIFWRV